MASGRKGPRTGFPMGRTVRYGTVYLPIHGCLLLMLNVGKYTVRPMNLMGLVTIVFLDTSLVVSVVGLDH